MKELGLFFRKARIKNGYTQRELSIKLGYGYAQFVSNWERGISEPSIRAIKKMIPLFKLNKKKTVQFVARAHYREMIKKLGC